MEPIEPGKRVRELLNKYKYALLILAVGLLLMLLPQQSATATEETEPTEAAEQIQTMEQLLQDILQQVDGAGEVAVLLSEQEGEQTIYQTDTQTDADEGSSSNRAETVIVTNADRDESGLVLRRDPPKYQGAVIVCQGGDRADVRLAIVEAVQCATGLGANQICVVKMK